MTQLRILNVDEDEATREAKRRILTSAGHHVVDADSGAEALASLARTRLELALVHHRLPDMTGRELTRLIRANPGTRHLPVIHVSDRHLADGRPDDGMDGFPDAYLGLPLEPERLLSLVTQVFWSRQVGDAGDLRGVVTRNRLLEVESFIRANLDKRLTLRDLAGAAKLSPFYFTRMFKAAMGATPHEYLVKVRIEEARKLLVETPLPVGEIAKRLGFRTLAHFSAVFRRLTGLSPRAYRENQARDRR